MLLEGLRTKTLLAGTKASSVQSKIELAQMGFSSKREPELSERLDETKDTHAIHLAVGILPVTLIWTSP